MEYLSVTDEEISKNPKKQKELFDEGYRLDYVQSGSGETVWVFSRLLITP